MSFEGYFQVICHAGHYSSMDCYDFEDVADWICKDIVDGRSCNHTAQWWNLVDTTNGSWDGDGNRIDGYIKLDPKEPATFCVCTSCNNRHLLTLPLYEPPSDGGCLIGES